MMDCPPPKMSVVIPAYARPERLRACLQALARQDYPLDRLEVVVVDDGSPEPLEPHARSAAGDLNLTVLRQPNRGPAAARNAGARAAVGTVLAFTDDDCAPHPRWLWAFAGAIGDASDALFGGRTVNGLPGNPYSAASQQLVEYLYDYFERTRGTPVFFTSNSIALERERFLASGGFDESFPVAGGEDREYCYRWRHSGKALRFVADAVVEHMHHLTLGGFWRQHQNYGRGACRLDRALIRGERPRHSLEPLSFYLGLVAYPLSRGPAQTRLQRCGLMALSQLATAVGYAREKAGDS